MLISHSYQLVCANGKVLSGALSFKDGMTAITGPNGAGKSTAIETIVASLFGLATMRGTGEDWAKVSLETTFKVKDQTYTVTRTKSKALLVSGAAEIASGNKPVTTALKRIFGYGQDVFEVANFIRQGDITAFMAMSPTERKNLIDRTIGLDQLDKLADQCGAKALALAKEADALSRLLVEPEAPSEPPGYRSVAELDVELAQARADADEEMRLEAWLSNPPTVPTEPVETVKASVEALEAYQDERRGIQLGLQAAVTQAKAVPVATMSLEDIEKAEAEWAAWHKSEEKRKALAGLIQPTMLKEHVVEGLAAWDAYRLAEAKKRSLSGLVEPTYDRDTLQILFDAWDAYELWNRRVKLEERLTKCPECGHEWSDDAAWEAVKDAHQVVEPSIGRAKLTEMLRQLDAWEASAELRAKLAEVPDATRPSVGEEAYRTAERQCDAWEASAELRAKYEGVVHVGLPPATPEVALRKQRLALADAERLTSLLDEVKRLTDWLNQHPDRGLDLAERRRYEASRLAWAEARRIRAEWDVEAQPKRLRLSLLAGSLEHSNRLQDRRVAAAVYESQQLAYATALGQFQANVEACDELRRRSDQWGRARKGVILLKGKVKSYLLPSLNRAASGLVWQMSRGRFTTLLVDEAFNLHIDGQGIDTLSGSERAVASLALRVALGLVLTARVFPVLVGDEIDESCDEDRAQAVADALAGLGASLKQIILVSHKGVETENVVSL